MALAALGLAALAGWWNFGQFQFAGGSLHFHEFFHYYLGSKYFPELGYTGLYDCVAAVDVEQGFAQQAAMRWIRNLETNELRIGSPSVENPDICRSRFSPERWASFSHDVAWFRAHLNSRKWTELSTDHGYNATPVWNVAGHVLSNTGPATWGQIRLLAFIDPVLLLVMWALVCWTFGWRVACVAAIWWGTNYPARYTYIGGAFLREDWLALAVAAICFARRERMWLSGFAVTWSALLRIFPGFLVIGLLAKIGVDSWRARRLRVSPSHWRFAGGALLALLIWLPISISVGVGGHADPSVWSRFAKNSRKHLATPLTNNVGLPALISFEPSTRAVHVQGFWLDSPWDAWKDARLRVFEQRRILYYIVVAGFLALLAAACRGQADWVALTLAVGAIPFFVDLTSYYYGILLAFAFLWPRDWLAGPLLSLCAALTCLAPAVFAADDDRHVAISLIILVFISTMTIRAWRARRAEPAVPNLAASPA